MAGVLVVLAAGCGFANLGEPDQHLSGTSGEVPTEVLDGYQSISGRPFPDDVDVLGWDYRFGWLDDAATFVIETTATRAEELAALEEDSQPVESVQSPSVGVSSDRIDVALERRPIRTHESQGVGFYSTTTVMGDGDIVTVVLVAFEV